MNLPTPVKSIVLFALLSLVYGCSAFQTFGVAARSGTGAAGDTVALAMGWNQDVDRNEVTVTITDSLSAVTTYLAGDPAVRALINTYPDPVSRLYVYGETNQQVDNGIEPLFLAVVEGAVTSGDKDLSQKVIFVDLPAGMSTGPATVSISNSGGTIATFNVDVVAGDGVPSDFGSQGITVTSAHIRAMERAVHKVITFNGSTVPHAIEVDFTHDPDVNNGGSGVAYVVNPRGDIKNVSWTDDGTNLKVILLPTTNASLNDFIEFKFYVAGTITGLSVNTVQAYDVNGVEVPGVAVVIN